jgi:nitroimidazol reductase NimA-like FMN-containing flavoprotein (pyridoxamine 5'-phosphate oxidase superfamily)
MKLKKAEMEFVGLARVCRLATFDGASRPHCVPVCPVFSGKLIYFASEKNAKKVKNLQRDAGVALSFDDYSEAWSGLRGVMVQGKGKIIQNAPLFRKVRRLLYVKYPQYEKESPIGERDSAIVEVTPEHAFSWGLG